jgi:hypothetical protein
MKVRELITVLGFEIEDQKLKDLDASVDRVKSGILMMTAAVVGAGAALYSFVKTSANVADEINKTALAAGVSNEALQRLGYAAAQSGASMEELGVGLRFLSKNMYEASKNPKSELAKAFHSLGVSAVDAHGKVRPTADVLLQVSDRFKSIQNPAQKAAMAMQLFGRSGGGLLEFLNSGSAEIQKLGAEIEVMSDIDITNLKAFNDAVDGFLYFIGAIKNKVAAELAPVMVDMVASFKDFVTVNKDLIKENLLGFFRALASVLGYVFRIAMSLGSAFLHLAKYMGGVENLTKFLLWGFLALGAGSVIRGIMGIVTALRAVGVAGIFASLVPLLWIAAFAAIAAGIFLVVDDLVAYFEGRKSITAIIVKRFDEAWEDVKAGFQRFKEWLLSGADDLSERLGKIFTTIKKLHPVTNVWSAITGEGLPALDFIRSFGKNGTPGGSPTGATPTTKPIDSGWFGNSFGLREPPAQTVTQHNTVTVHADGANPATVHEKVESGLAKSLNFQDLIRRTNQVTSPSVGY